MIPAMLQGFVELHLGRNARHRGVMVLCFCLYSVSLISLYLSCIFFSVSLRSARKELKYKYINKLFPNKTSLLRKRFFPEVIYIQAVSIIYPKYHFKIFLQTFFSRHLTARVYLCAGLLWNCSSINNFIAQQLNFFLICSLATIINQKKRQPTIKVYYAKWEYEEGEERRRGRGRALKQGGKSEIVVLQRVWNTQWQSWDGCSLEPQFIISCAKNSSVASAINVRLPLLNP